MVTVEPGPVPDAVAVTFIESVQPTPRVPMAVSSEEYERVKVKGTPRPASLASVSVEM